MYADGLVATHELQAAQAAAQIAKAEIPVPPGFGSGIGGVIPDAASVWTAFAAVAAVEGSAGFRRVPICVLEALRCESSSELRGEVTAEWAASFATEEWVTQANSVREVFGNPYCPVSVDRSWLTPTVASLTESIYQEESFDRLRMLADGLEEAGCTNTEILNHCRSPGPHVRGCWVIDLLLGKE
jgi:hypothetical protein